MTEHELIQKIAARAAALYERVADSRERVNLQRVTSITAMELTIVHQEIVPLRLEDLLNADDFNLAHDVFGIHRHLLIDKRSRLADCFLPRFAKIDSDVPLLSALLPRVG